MTTKAERKQLLLDNAWTRWCADYDAARGNVQQLFHRRHIWALINKMWEASWDEIGLNNLVQNWFISTYVEAQCIGIRRESWTQDGSSLDRCLVKLISNPEMASRARYEEAIRSNPDVRPEYHPRLFEGFNEFAAPETGHVDPDLIQRDLDALRAAARTTHKYTDKVIAHRDPRVEKISLTWADLDGALNAVGVVFQRYWKLRFPGNSLHRLTPDLPAGWAEPFRKPWCPADFYPDLPAEVMDDYITGRQPDAPDRT